MSYQATHAAPRKPVRDRLRWSRRRKLVALAAAILALTVATALALLLLRAPVTGGGSVVAPTGFRFTAVSVANGSCTASLASGTVTLRFDEATAGSICNLVFTVQRTGQNQDMRIQDFRFSTVTDEGFTGIMNTDGCRAPVPLAPGTLDVPVRITIPTSAPAGAFTADADAGMTAISVADYVDANCPRAA